MSRSSRLGGLALLYASRAAGVLVSLVFIPLYARLLDQQEFGWVAMILSAQALLMAFDLGMSPLTARDLATGPAPAAALARWVRAEKLLVIQFAALCALAIIPAVAMGWSVWAVIACVVLFWSVAAQNVAQSAMLALGQVKQAALVQATGVLARAAITAATLFWIDASLAGFIASQLLGSLFHLALNRQLGQKRLRSAREPGTPDEESLSGLARRGFPLFLVAAMGAAVMQVDKLLIGAFMGSAAVAPYFLAGTFCTVPIALLASPMSQFFQPPVIRAHANRDADGVRHRTRHLSAALLAAVVAPTLLLWLVRAPLIEFWLRDPALAEDVVALAGIMLPATAIGAFGFVPLALLAAVADFSFQARLSAVMTGLTLTAAAWAASRGDLQGICYIYLAYHGMVTVALWVRAAGHESTRVSALASARLCLSITAILVLPVAVFFLISGNG